MAAPRTRPRCRNIHHLPKRDRLLLIGRASEFDIDPKTGREIPRYGYRRIARNFSKLRRVNVSFWAVRRLVVRNAPEIARRRGDAYAFARRTRKASSPGQ